MEHRRSKLALFFVTQALAVAAMIVLLHAGRRMHCDNEGCWQASGVSVTFALLVILGELWILAAALRVDGPVWKTLAGLGILSLIVAVYATGTCWGLHTRSAVAPVVAMWHLAAGLLLLATGSAAGAWELMGRLRRTDDASSLNDRGASAMWPLD
jgi:hypothetical protein